MSTTVFSIADLPTCDDLNVPMDPDSYVDQANPRPPLPGNYRFRVTKSSVRKTKDGRVQMVDGKFPILLIEQAEIIEPQENQRLVGLFQDIRSKPFTRNAPNGQKVVASDIYDLLRAFDANQRVDDFEHAKQLLLQYFEQSATFVAALSWEGYDKTFVEAEFQKVGGKAVASADVAKAIYKQARLSTKSFIKGGIVNPQASGPSGATIEAQPKLSRYYPSTEVDEGKVKLGPFNRS